jgi:hypothetical protein
MIGATLDLLTRELNASLRRGLGLDGDIAVLSAVVGLDGQAVPQAEDRLAVFLVNIERDAAGPRSPVQRGGGLNRLMQGQPAVWLNLLVMFAANFRGANYAESLKLIAHTVAFFQSRPVFEPQNCPGMDRDIARVVLDLESLSINDLTNLWGMLGGHYLPSVLYRVRLLRIDAGLVDSQVPLVMRSDSGAHATQE